MDGFLWCAWVIGFCWLGFGTVMDKAGYTCGDDEGNTYSAYHLSVYYASISLCIYGTVWGIFIFCGEGY